MSTDIPHAVRVAVRSRSRGVCERCLMAVATEMAHRIPRGPGWHFPSNLGHLCSKCHRFCHENPQASRADGWILPKNSRITPASVVPLPARTAMGWVTFTSQLVDRKWRSTSVPINEEEAFRRLDEYGLRGVA